MKTREDSCVVYLLCYLIYLGKPCLFYRLCPSLVGWCLELRYYHNRPFAWLEFCACNFFCCYIVMSNYGHTSFSNFLNWLKWGMKYGILSEWASMIILDVRKSEESYVVTFSFTILASLEDLIFLYVSCFHFFLISIRLFQGLIPHWGRETLRTMNTFRFVV